MTNIQWIKSADEYVSRLKSHDWFYDFSDAIGSGRWQHGHDNYFALANAREKFDPDGTVWNKYSPSLFKITEIEEA